MAKWFGKRRQRAGAVDALLGAAQERGIPTMRVEDPEELSAQPGVWDRRPRGGRTYLHRKPSTEFDM